MQVLVAVEAGVSARSMLEAYIYLEFVLRYDKLDISSEAPGGGAVGPNLSNEANAGHSRQWFSTQIHDPQTLMPAYGTLTDKQVSDIVSYLLSLSTAHSKGSESRSIEAKESGTISTEPNSFSVEQAGRRWSQTCGQCHNLRSPAEYNDDQWQVAVHHVRIRVPLTGAEPERNTGFPAGEQLNDYARKC